ncbi:hypothetical protein KC221_31460, partial [Mycobacterium tuberculosis]|nr:hypothetical protein [Mycobacterium tuberculosis]
QDPLRPEPDECRLGSDPEQGGVGQVSRDVGGGVALGARVDLFDQSVDDDEAATPAPGCPAEDLVEYLETGVHSPGP